MRGMFFQRLVVLEFEKTDPVLDFVVTLCKNDGDQKILKQVQGEGEGGGREGGGGGRARRGRGSGCENRIGINCQVAGAATVNSRFGAGRRRAAGGRQGAR